MLWVIAIATTVVLTIIYGMISELSRARVGFLTSLMAALVVVIIYVVMRIAQNL